MKSVGVLSDKMSAFYVPRYYTDDWKSYSKLIPASKHMIWKSDIWVIERLDLNFRTYIKSLNRKSICFSKNEKIHGNVIGMYIDRYYFKNDRYCRKHLINRFDPPPIFPFIFLRRIHIFSGFRSLRLTERQYHGYNSLI